MDQEKGAGHHVITAKASEKVFGHVGNGGKVLGLTLDQFSKTLDHWQAFADRSPLGWHEHTPTGLGNTWQPSWMNPDAQREHSMADPHKDGPKNIKDIKEALVSHLDSAHLAHTRGDTTGEWRHLGAAAHLLEDSYSSAHVFRDPASPADPTAKIMALLNFGPGTPLQTHDGVFDKVPVDTGTGRVERGSDQAAVQAVSDMIAVYVMNVTASKSDAHTAFTAIVSPYFHESDDVRIFLYKYEKAYLEYKDGYFQNEVCRDRINEGKSAASPGDIHGVLGSDSAVCPGDAPEHGGASPATKDGAHPVDQGYGRDDGGSMPGGTANAAELTQATNTDHAGSLANWDPAYDGGNATHMENTDTVDQSHHAEDGGSLHGDTTDADGLTQPTSTDHSDSPSNWDPAHDGGNATHMENTDTVVQIDHAGDGGSLPGGTTNAAGLTQATNTDHSGSLANWDPAHDGGNATHVESADTVDQSHHAADGGSLHGATSDQVDPSLHAEDHLTPDFSQTHHVEIDHH